MFIFYAIWCIKESEWLGVAFFAFLICFRFVELIINYLMYYAVQKFNWFRMKGLIKVSLTMFVLINILFIALSFGEEDDGEAPKPVEAIIGFVTSAVIVAVWFWYLCKYISNGKLL